MYVYCNNSYLGSYISTYMTFIIHILSEQGEAQNNVINE